VNRAPHLFARLFRVDNPPASYEENRAIGLGGVYRKKIARWKYILLYIRHVTSPMSLFERSYEMLNFLKAWMVSHLPQDEKGQDAAEYALLIAFIALVIVGAVVLLGNNISAVFDSIAGTIAGW
jgi:pilus assembly protein Flp/PilA